MMVFEEKQQFRQWWLIAILAVAVGVLLVNYYFETEGFTYIESKTSLVFSVILPLIIIGSIFILELRTRIDSIGITANFHPFPFFRKHYTWQQIAEIYVREYSAITEYGGWGIRGLGKSTAYNVSGSFGIQIVTKQNKRFLIGTQKHDEVQKFLARYQEKIKT